MGVKLFSYLEMIRGATSFASKQAANIDCPRAGVKSLGCCFSLLCDPVKISFHFLRTTSPEKQLVGREKRNLTPGRLLAFRPQALLQ